MFSDGNGARSRHSRNVEALRMQLRPLYTVRFHYPDGWQVDLAGSGGTEEHHYFFAEGRCEGTISGRFRAANHPRRRTDKTFAMNMQGFVETDEGGLIMVDYQGYGVRIRRVAVKSSVQPGMLAVTTSTVRSTTQSASLQVK